MNKVSLYSHQQEAVEKLRSGSVLVGGVGSGKSITSLYFYFTKICNGDLDSMLMTKPKDLYVITTAKKRDNLEWQKECVPFLLINDKENPNPVKIVVDSWNNIKKYTEVRNAFFIFDEQRVVGSGTWVKSFIKITKANEWILLTATPGDNWLDYAPVFIANGYYKNRTDFIRNHVVYRMFGRYYQVERYVGVRQLARQRQEIVVTMTDTRDIKIHSEDIYVSYDKELTKDTTKTRWDPFKNEPIEDVVGLCYTLRRITNASPERIDAIRELLEENDKVIIFYNFNYELEILKNLAAEFPDMVVDEWNGHRHGDVPEGDRWCYLVQYFAGAEGWNCITTNVMIFYSQSYSYKMTKQAAGRINRINTSYKDLYYYYIKSDSPIDKAISRSLGEKKDFNERQFLKELEGTKYLQNLDSQKKHAL